MVRIAKLRNYLIRFMYGRYGVDQLYRGLTGLLLIFVVINFFIQSSVMNAIVLLTLILMYFRVFSKNIYKRQKENSRYLKMTKSTRKEMKLTIRRIKEIGTHRYRKCPNCHQTIRLKRKLGKHTTICPKCHSKVKVTIVV